jgi:catechol 1,2-dioxygenase
MRHHLHRFLRPQASTTDSASIATFAKCQNLNGKDDDDHRQPRSHNEVVQIAGSLGVSSLICLHDNGDRGRTRGAAFATGVRVATGPPSSCFY